MHYARSVKQTVSGAQKSDTPSKGIPMTFNYAIFWYTGRLPVAAGGGAFVYRYETIEEAQDALCQLHTLNPAIAYTLVKVIGTR